MKPQNYHIEQEHCKNTLGMDITVYHIVGDDNSTYAETRHQDIAYFIAKELTEKKGEL